MEAAFSSYTIIVMFICAVACTAGAATYAITRNRVYLFVASAFFLYFFDLSFIFQTEYLNHGAAISLSDLYEIRDPYLKAIIAGGILESLWLAICGYLGRQNMLLQALPGMVFIAVDFLIAALMADGPVKQWLFYSTREVFLVWCLAYLAWLSKAKSTDASTRTLVKHQKKIVVAAAVLVACIIAENTFVILVWQPDQATMDSMLPIYIAERNFSENILVILFAALTARHAADLFRLRHNEPPTPKESSQKRYVESALSLYGERYNLTARERDVLRAIIDGKDNQNIASDLHLALGTVKTHTHNIFKKTGTKTRQELLQQFWKS